MGTYTERLAKVTFSIHHSPNCLKPFQVRLVSKAGGIIDNKMNYSETEDIIGHGLSLEEAAKEAWQKKYETD